MAKFFGRDFDEQPFMAKCLWLVVATFAFIACFYTGTFLMSLLYALDEALLGF